MPGLKSPRNNQQSDMKNQTQIPVCQSSIYYAATPENRVFLRVSCGIKPSGESYCVTDAQSELEEAKCADANYLPGLVRAFATETGAERISEALAEMLPVGFKLILTPREVFPKFYAQMDTNAQALR